MDREITEKTAWPANPIEQYESGAVGVWGYLYLYSDNKFHFSVDEKPTEEEINKRWSYYFKANGNFLTTKKG